jgi:hypothetical protein
MTHREQLWAFLATLGTIIILNLGALLIVRDHPELVGKMEAFGLGLLNGGLIGILRFPSARTVTVDNPPNNPVPVEPNP